MHSAIANQLIIMCLSDANLAPAPEIGQGASFAYPLETSNFVRPSYPSNLETLPQPDLADTLGTQPSPAGQDGAT